MKKEYDQGVEVKRQTDAGKQLGIVVVDVEGWGGKHYFVLKYPPIVQKMIVEHYIKH